jgi:hypothetical protein
MLSTIQNDRGPVLCGIAVDHGPALFLIARELFVEMFYVDPALCCIARDHGPALCGIVRDQHIFVNFSANLK